MVLSDIEGRFSTVELDSPMITSDATGIANSTADHENPPPFDWLKVFITAAVVCVCALPGSAIVLKKRYSSNTFLNISVTVLEYPYMLMIYFCFPQNWGLRKQEPCPSKGIAGIYNRSRKKPSVFGRAFMGSRLLARTGLPISWFLAVNVLVPKFKKLKLLGSPLWRWSLLAFIVPAAYFAAIFICLYPLLSCVIVAITKRKRLNYPLLYSGLLGNLILVLYSGIILGAWLGYFRTKHGLKTSSIPHVEAIFDQVTWICVSLFVGSILWLVKAYILMLWSTRAIYRRFEPRILMTTVKFMYLGLIAGDFFVDSIIRKMKLVEEYLLHPAPETYSFQKYILSKHVDIAYLVLASQHLTSLSKIVKPLEEEGVPKLLDYLSEKITATNDICEVSDLVDLINCRDLSNRNLERLLLRRKYGYLARLYQLFGSIFHNPPESNLQTPENHDSPADAIPIKLDELSPGQYRNNIANVLHCILREQCPSNRQNQITFDDLKRWMVDAHLNCVNMGRTLADAAAIVTRLNIVISIMISIIVALMWLLISGIATTKVLVTIGTPLVASTFIFGESAKTFFQGIIFCFGTHSFDVGDRCMLDGTEVEVEKISIMTTRFIKIGTEERRMYPNSILAAKPISNKGWEPDPSDAVELKLDMSTFRKEWEALESKLERFFGDDEHKGVFQSWHEVTMEEMDDKIKVIIHFKHVLNVKEMTHSQCFQKKRRQRPLILKSITRFLEPDQPIGNGDSTTPVNSQVVPTNVLRQPSNKLWNGLV